LYYAIGAVFVRLINLDADVSWVPNPYFTWPDHPLRNGAAIHTLTELWPYHGMVLGVHVLRLMSSLMGAGTVACAYLAALALTGRRQFALATGGLVALTPGFLMSSALVTNDNIAASTGSLALLVGVKVLKADSRRWLWALLFIASIGLAYASKPDTLFLVPAAVILGLIVFPRSPLWPMVRRLPWRVWITAFAAAGFFIAVALAIHSYTSHLRNTLILVRLGTIKAAFISARLAPCPHCVKGQWLWGAVPDLYDTFWGSFGWETFHLPLTFYQVLFAFCALGAGGLLYGGVRWLRMGHRPSLAPWAFFASAATVLFVVVVYRAMSTHGDGGTTHGRFLFPVIVAILAILALGLWSLPRAISGLAFGGLFLTLLATVGYSLWTVSHAFIWAPVYGDALSAGVQHAKAVSFEKGMDLAGFSLPSNRVAPGQQLHLRLFWDARRPVDFDYSAFVRLEDAAGHIIHNQDHVPGVEIGLLTHQWQPGEVIPDDWTLAIPTDASPGPYRLAVGVYDYRNLKPLLDQAASPATTMGTVAIMGGPGG